MDQTNSLLNNGQNHYFPEIIDKILSNIDGKSIRKCNKSLKKFIESNSISLEKILEIILENSLVRDIMFKSVNCEHNERFKLILLFNFICTRCIEYCRERKYLIEFIFSSYQGTLSIEG